MHGSQHRRKTRWFEASQIYNSPETDEKGNDIDEMSDSRFKNEPGDRSVVKCFMLKR